MKHVNGKYSQFDNVPEDQALKLMESMGYIETDNLEDEISITSYFRHNTSYFALSEQVVESNDGLFLKITELPGNAILDENSHKELIEVEFEGDNYELNGVFESDDGLYTKMNIVPVEENEDIVIKFEGKDYMVVDTEEEADFVMFVTESEDGDVSVVSESDEYTDKVYLVAIDEGCKDEDEKEEKDEKEETPKKKKGKSKKKLNKKQKKELDLDDDEDIDAKDLELKRG